MPEHGHENSMSDELLDRELAALLSVEPSPAFVARVRVHVASQERTPVSWLNARGLALAVVLVVAVGAAVAIRTGQSRYVDSSQARAGEQPAFVIPQQTSRVTALPAQPSAHPAPEVLISPSESRVVERLLIAARGTVVAPDAHSFEETDATLLPPMPIDIAPIRLEPLAAVAEIESGAVQ